MDSGQSNIVALIFLVAAVLIFLKLRSVLGRRTGDEPARYERFRAERAAAEARSQANPRADGATIELPRTASNAPADPAARESDAVRQQRLTQFAGGNADLARGLIAIAGADARFEPVEFLRGAKAAYETIVMSFAEGNKPRLHELLSEEVFAGFAEAIDERARRRETVEQSFVGIRSADLTHAEMHGSVAMATVTFVSELISATYSAERTVVAGDAARVKTVTDVWTFARDVTSSGPNWHLVATRAAGA